MRLNWTPLGFVSPGHVVNSDELVRLEHELAPLSHGTQALQLLQTFLKGIGKVSARQRFLSDHVLCPTIRYEEVPRHLGIEPFYVLQGDVVRTDTAYVLGRRQRGGMSYVVASSTCDLVPGRRESAVLLRIESRRPSDYTSLQKTEGELSNLIAFRSTRYFYLPALPDDEPDVLFNLAFLDPLAQCTNEAVVLAERRASMTLIGWRLLGAVLRTAQVREAEGEATLRGDSGTITTQ